MGGEEENDQDGEEEEEEEKKKHTSSGVAVHTRCVCACACVCASVPPSLYLCLSVYDDVTIHHSRSLDEMSEAGFGGPDPRTEF